MKGFIEYRAFTDIEASGENILYFTGNVFVCVRIKSN